MRFHGNSQVVTGPGGSSIGRMEEANEAAVNGARKEEGLVMKPRVGGRPAAEDDAKM